MSRPSHNCTVNVLYCQFQETFCIVHFSCALTICNKKTNLLDIIFAIFASQSLAEFMFCVVHSYFIVQIYHEFLIRNDKVVCVYLRMKVNVPLTSLPQKETSAIWLSLAVAMRSFLLTVLIYLHPYRLNGNELFLKCPHILLRTGRHSWDCSSSIGIVPSSYKQTTCTYLYVSLPHE